MTFALFTGALDSLFWILTNECKTDVILVFRAFHALVQFDFPNVLHLVGYLYIHVSYDIFRLKPAITNVD